MPFVTTVTVGAVPGWLAGAAGELALHAADPVLALDATDPHALGRILGVVLPITLVAALVVLGLILWPLHRS